jgi:hypothetical protein
MSANKVVPNENFQFLLRTKYSCRIIVQYVYWQSTENVVFVTVRHDRSESTAENVHA